MRNRGRGTGTLDRRLASLDRIFQKLPPGENRRRRRLQAVAQSAPALPGRLQIVDWSCPNEHVLVMELPHFLLAVACSRKPPELENTKKNMPWQALLQYSQCSCVASLNKYNLVKGLFPLILHTLDIKRKMCTVVVSAICWPCLVSRLMQSDTYELMPPG